MRLGHGGITAATVFLILFAGSGNGAPADCVALRPRAEAALANAAQAGAVFTQVMQVCDAVYADWYGRQIASRIYSQQISSAKPDETILKDALRYGRPWQLLASLASFAADRKDWTAAARLYQDSLTEIGDRERTTAEPPKEVIASLIQKAQQAELLAADYVPTTRSRDGTNAGLAAVRVRSITIEKVALPVEFVFGKTEFTDKGRRAAEDMADFLKNETPKPAEILLIGHTDPVGSDSYNVVLSQQRAKALAAFLQSRSVGIRIRADGKGKSEPFVPDQPSKYSQEERYQMDRRVELIRE